MLQRANRRNAERATGPRSETGKRHSAQNAVRNRLSVPLPADLLDPLREQVTDLLRASEVPEDHANELAEKVIEFERNMALFREAEQRWLAMPFDHPERAGRGMARLPPDQDPVLDALIQTPWQASDKSMTREQYQVFQKSARELLKLEAKSQRRTAVALDRYLRRARNQLIKTLKRIE